LKLLVDENPAQELAEQLRLLSLSNSEKRTALDLTIRSIAAVQSARISSGFRVRR
jgi:hypothetical protein